MLESNDAIDLMRGETVSLGNETVFAVVVCTLGNKPANIWGNQITHSNGVER